MQFIFVLIFTGCISNILHTMQPTVLQQAKESLIETSKEITISQKTHQSTAWRLKAPLMSTFVGLGCQACGAAANYFIHDPDVKMKAGLASFYAGFGPLIYSVYTLIRDYRNLYKKTEPLMRQVIEEEVSEEVVEDVLTKQEELQQQV